MTSFPCERGVDEVSLFDEVGFCDRGDKEGRPGTGGMPLKPAVGDTLGLITDGRGTGGGGPREGTLVCFSVSEKLSPFSLTVLAAGTKRDVGLGLGNGCDFGLS